MVFRDQNMQISCNIHGNNDNVIKTGSNVQYTDEPTMTNVCMCVCVCGGIKGREEEEVGNM